MTMVPAAHHQNLSGRHQYRLHRQQDQHQEDIIVVQEDCCQTPESFGSHMSPLKGCYYGNYGHRRLFDLESDLVALGGRRNHHQHMAEEDESRTSSSFNDKTASSSKDFHDEQRDHESWLQLRMGNDSSGGNNGKKLDTTPPQRGGGLVELDILPTTPPPLIRPVLPPPPPRPPIFHLPQFQSPLPIPVASFMNGNTSSASGASSSSPWLFLQQQQHQQQGSSSSNNPYFIFPPPPQQQDNSWGFIRPVMSMTHQNYHQNYNIPFGIGSFPARPPHHQMQQGGVGMMDVRRQSIGVRLIDTPRRPHSGVWFMLQASPTQSKEPFLPQISKSYLRIKDGRMTVRLLLKYLVNKLTLDNESEVEISCRGQQLLPLLTLQHVRDNIWSQGDAVTLLPDSSTMDHLMVLHYGRTTTTTTTTTTSP